MHYSAEVVCLQQNNVLLVYDISVCVLLRQVTVVHCKTNKNAVLQT